MKLNVLLLFLTTLGLLARNDGYGQSKRIDLTIADASIIDVFNEIEKLSEFKIFYKVDALDLNRKYSVNAKNTAVGDLLNDVLSDLDVSYELVDKIIVITPDRLFQDIKVKGKITDINGNPVPGANIIVKGTNIGAVSDLDGNYEITVGSEDAVLEFSFVGYLTEEVPVEGRSVIDVTLIEDIKSLEEVVVVGYGTQKSRKVTGAISSVNISDIEGRPVTDVSQSLSGLAAGVQITQGSGQPGQDDALIRIRGIGTLNNANPLILVDGIASGMSGLDPNDIENITVLKDAASAAIYGSRAANGVILITTKKGKQGQASLSYHGYMGWQSPTRLMDLITDMSSHMELLNEAKTNLDRLPQFPQSEIDAYKANKDPILYPNTDWFDYYFGEPTPVTNHNISANGGNDLLLYNLSIGYLNQDGLEGETSKERYNLRLNTEVKLTNRLKAGTNFYGYWQTLKGNPNVMNIIKDGAGSPGVLPVHPDGRFGGPQVEGEGFVGNPAATLAAQDQTRNSQFFLGKLYAEYEFFDGLTLQTNAALKFNNFKYKGISEPFILWNFRTDEIARESNQTVISLGESNDFDKTLTSYTTLNYQKSFGDHFLNVLAGHSIETFESENFSASIKDLFSTTTSVIDAGTLEPNVGGNFTEWALISYFGRINYDFMEKYLFEANLRYDGSSRFAEGNRWGTFPSFSLGWRVSEEEFFPTLAFVSDFKIRGSWGQLGNQNIGNYPYQAVYSLAPKYSFGGQLQTGAAQTVLANQNIKWETTTTTDIGFDLNLFENRFQGSFDWFNRVTNDILVTLPIAKTYGDKAPPVQNIAQVDNKGWELVLSYRQKLGDFSFGIGTNITQVENEVVKFKGEVPSISGVFLIQEGYPIHSIYAYNAVGIFQTEDEVAEWARQDANTTAPGDLKYEDFDGNEVINGDDRQVVGNTVPKYYYGFNLDFGWKGFDVAALFQGIADVDRYLTGQFVHPFATNDRTLTPTRWLDRWTPDNPDASMPRVIIGGDYGWNYAGSTFWMEDGSFLRLKNLQLGYTLPSNISQRVGLDNVRVYGNGQNLLTFTDYTGYDPETTQTGQFVGYPNTKIVSVGLQVKF